MGYVNLKVPFGLADVFDYQIIGSLSSSSGFRLNSTGSYSAGRFFVEKSGVISDVGFYVHSIVGTGTFGASLVTLSSIFSPTSTNYGGSIETTFSSEEVSVGWNWITLTQPATGTASDLVAVKIYSISSDASNYLAMPSDIITLAPDIPGGTIAGVYGRPIKAFRYNDGHVYGYPIRAGYSVSYNTGSSTNYYGLKFTLPFDAKCNGVRFAEPINALNSSGTILLYDTDDNILFQKQIVVAGTALGSDYEVMFDELSLSSNVNYRLVVRADKNTNTLSRGIIFTTGTYRYTLPNGEYCMKTYRTGTTGYTFGSGWVDDESSVPYISMLLNQVEYSTGTSSTSSGSSTSGYYGWAS